MRRSICLLVSTAALALGSTVAPGDAGAQPSSPAPAPAPAPADGTGEVVVVHGLEGFPADVYLDGGDTPALSGFEFRRVTDPLSLPAGPHRADLRRAGQAASAAPALSGSFEVVPGQRITLAALLSPSGQPTWLAFPNDAWPSHGPGQGEVRFRHFAAAEPVDLLVDGQVVRPATPNLSTSGPVAPLVVAPGSHALEVRDAATGATRATRQLEVAAGSVLNVYLTGRGDRLDLRQEGVSTPSALAAAPVAAMPTAIAGGDSGLADPGVQAAPGGGPTPALLAAGAVGAVAAALATRARRRQPAR